MGRILIPDVRFKRLRLDDLARGKFEVDPGHENFSGLTRLYIAGPGDKGKIWDIESDSMIPNGQPTYVNSGEDFRTHDVGVAPPGGWTDNAGGCIHIGIDSNKALSTQPWLMAGVGYQRAPATGYIFGCRQYVLRTSVSGFSYSGQQNGAGYFSDGAAYSSQLVQEYRWSIFRRYEDQSNRAYINGTYLGTTIAESYTNANNYARFGWNTTGSTQITVYLFGHWLRSATPYGLASRLSKDVNNWPIRRRVERSYFFVGVGATAGIGAALDGTAQATATATGALTTQIPLTGGALSAAAASGTLSTSIPLSGSATVTSTADGQLSTQITLSGDALAQAVAAAGLTTAIPLAGDAGAQAGASGDLAGGAAQLSGIAQAVADGTATLTTQIRLDGAAIAQALASGDLTAPGAGLSGTAQATAAASGDLITQIPLGGAALTASSASGDLTTIIPLSGSAASVASATGSLDISLSLSGAALAQAAAAGELTARITLDGAAVAQAAASGVLASGQYRRPAEWRLASVLPEQRIVVARRGGYWP